MIDCPACGAWSDVSDGRCPKCGYPIGAPETEKIRANLHRYWELTSARRTIESEMWQLAHERSDLLEAVYSRLGPAPWVPRPGSSESTVRCAAAPAVGSGSEWDSRSIRTVLLWLGSTLLVLSAVGFAGYEWTQLRPPSRAAVLAVAALGTSGAGLALQCRLPATAKALGTVGQLLVPVDWALLRHAGVGAGLATEMWWALGAVLSAAIGLGLGGLGQVTGRVLGAIAAVAALPLLIDAAVPLGYGSGEHLAGQVALWSVLAALYTALARALWRSPRWHVSALVGAWSTGACQIVAVVGAAILGIEVVRGSAGPAGVCALAIASVAASPFLVRYLWFADIGEEGARSAWGHAAVAAVALSFLGAATVALSPFVPGIWLPTALIGLGLTGVVAMRILPSSSSRGIAVAVAIVTGIGATFVAAPAVVTVLAPLGWWGHGWTGSLNLPAAAHLAGPVAFGNRRHGRLLLGWPALTSLVVLGSGMAVATDWHRMGGVDAVAAQSTPSVASRPLLGIGVASWFLVALAVPALAMAPLLLGADILGEIACLQFTVGGLVATWYRASRRGSKWAGILPVAAVVVEVPCLGWCTATAASTTVVLAFAAVFAMVAATTAGTSSMRRGALAIALGMALACVGTTGAAISSPTMLLSLVVTGMAAIALVSLQSWPDGAATLPAEGVAVAGLLVPALWPLAEHSWFTLALCLTLGTLAAGFAAANARVTALRVVRRLYHLSPAAGAIPVTWAWLVAGDVHLVEAYTWPTAVFVTLLIAVAKNGERTTSPHLTSWGRFGPGLAIALVPSTALAISCGGLIRPLVLSVLALGIAVAGGRARLGSPLFFGGATLLVLGLNAAFPYVWEGPRWLVLGVVGALLIWFGATLERQRARVRRVGAYFGSLE